MARTTLDIDGPILREVKALQEREGRSMGRIVSELLAEALAGRQRPEEAELGWVSRPMRARVDVGDKDALYAVLDGPDAVADLDGVPDAHLATLLRQHGVRTLYTADVDFRRFAFLDVRNPLT